MLSRLWSSSERASHRRKSPGMNDINGFTTGGTSSSLANALPSIRRPSANDYRSDFGTNRTKGPPILRIVAALALFVTVFVWWSKQDARDHSRELGGSRVVARDWREYKHPTTFAKVKKSSKTPVPTIMIMCTMKDAIEHVWHFFQLIDKLDYPRSALQIAILVSDTTDRTYERALELADERQYKRSKKERYGRIMVLRKDFAMESKEVTGAMSGDIPVSAKIPHDTAKLVAASVDTIVGAGKARHEFGSQVHRRKMLAVSRTWLLNSALTPDIDYSLWIDVDVVDYEPRLIQTLLEYGVKEKADVIVPNCVWKTYNELGSYDRNNWQETLESRDLKATLAEDEVLIEGYDLHLKTGRLNMADLVPATPTTPEVMTLDGVGGCTTLINAGLHRRGAVFPAWPVDHQLETEGFAQLAKKVGGKMIGLPKYYVYHGLYG